MYSCEFDITVSQTLCQIMKCITSKRGKKSKKSGEAYSSWPITNIFFPVEAK